MDAMKCTYGCSHQCVLPSGLRHPLRPLPAAGTIPRKAQWLPSTKICSCSSITIQNSFKQHGDKWIFWQNEPTLSALKSRVFNPPSGYRKGEVSYFDKCTLSFQHNLPFFLCSVGFSFQTLNLVYLMMYSSIFSVAIFRLAVI